MESSLLAVPDQDLGRFLNQRLNDQPSHFRIASAYVSSAGIDILRDGIERTLDYGGSVSILHGIDLHVTRPETVKELANWQMDYENLEYRVSGGLSQGSTRQTSFHPKLYMIEGESENHTVIVGSSNLTQAGFTQNTEINSVFKGKAYEEPISSCISVYDKLFTCPPAVEPQADFVRIYEELWNEFNSQRRSAPLDVDFQARLKDLLQISPQPPWVPQNMDDLTVLVFQEEERRGNAQLHLTQITELVRLRAEQLGFAFVWSNLHNSIRRVMGMNEVQKSGQDLFRRVGSNNSGIYELTPKGRYWTG